MFVRFESSDCNEKSAVLRKPKSGLYNYPRLGLSSYGTATSSD